MPDVANLDMILQHLRSAAGSRVRHGYGVVRSSHAAAASGLYGPAPNDDGSGCTGEQTCPPVFLGTLFGVLPQLRCRLMLNSPKVRALRDTLSRAVMTVSTPLDNAADDTVHDEVCAVVDELKAAGWSPERAIIAVKEIAQEAGLTQSQGVLVRDCDLNPPDALLARIVRWTIECYYDTSRVA